MKYEYEYVLLAFLSCAISKSCVRTMRCSCVLIVLGLNTDIKPLIITSPPPLENSKFPPNILHLAPAGGSTGSSKHCTGGSRRGGRQCYHRLLHSARPAQR
eukprot:9350141-Pyramimonas_sp.AAC.1